MEVYKCLVCNNLVSWSQRSRKPKYVMGDNPEYKEEAISSWHLCLDGIKTRWTKCIRVYEEKLSNLEVE